MKSQLHIPERFLPLADATFYDAHDRMARKTVNDFLNDMPTEKYFEAGIDSVRYVDMIPNIGEYDRVVFSELPFGNGWGSNQYLRHLVMQQCALPDARIIVFPNNTIEQKVYSLDGDERQKVAAGDFTPVAQKQARVLASLKIDRINGIGPSQGASLAAATGRFIADKGVAEPGNFGFFEAPNVVDRSVKQLSSDFKATSLAEFNKAVNDSGIPALSEIQCARGWLDVPRQLGMFAAFGLGVLNPDNRALRKAMSHNTFFEDIEGILDKSQTSRVTVGYAENSAIMPAEICQDFNNLPVDSRLNLIEIPGYGHEVNYNIALNALLARLALRESTA